MGKPGLIVLGALCASGISFAAHAQLFKCDVGGKITYSDRPCESGRSSSVSIVPNSMDNSGLRREAGRLQREEQQTAAEQRRVQAQQQAQRAREDALAAAAESQKREAAECEDARRGLASLEGRTRKFSPTMEKARVDVEQKCGVTLPRPKRPCNMSGVLVGGGNVVGTVNCPD